MSEREKDKEEQRLLKQQLAEQQRQMQQKDEETERRIQRLEQTIMRISGSTPHLDAPPPPQPVRRKGRT